MAPSGGGWRETCKPGGAYGADARGEKTATPPYRAWSPICRPSPSGRRPASRASCTMSSAACSSRHPWISPGWNGRSGPRPDSPRSGEVHRRLGRLKDCLAGAVDIKRKIIEELRPTLLDNVGLFAALRWLVSTTAARTGLASVIRFPAAEPHFEPDAAIALFRMAQEGIGIILESKWVQSITLVLGGAERPDHLVGDRAWRIALARRENADQILRARRHPSSHGGARGRSELSRRTRSP